jgi:hypothetical protein
MLSPHAPTERGILTNQSAVHLSFSSAEPLVRFFYSVDGGAELEIEQRNKSVVWVHAVGDGPHSVQVRAMDVAGNILSTPCTTLNWFLDTKPPEANITSEFGATQKPGTGVKKDASNSYSWVVDLLICFGSTLLVFSYYFNRICRKRKKKKVAQLQAFAWIAGGVLNKKTKKNAVAPLQPSVEEEDLDEVGT